MLSFESHRLDVLVGRPDRTWTKEEIDVIDGEQLHKVSYLRKDGAEVSLWFSDAANGSLRRATFRRPRKNGVGTGMVDCSLKKFGDVWFPYKVVAHQGLNGQPHATDEWEVKHAEFNMDIDPKTFTVAGLGLAVGRAVVEMPGNKDYRWDGNKLVARRRDMNLARTQGTRQGTSVFWMVFGIVLAVGAALVLLRVWAKRAS